MWIKEKIKNMRFLRTESAKMLLFLWSPYSHIVFILIFALILVAFSEGMTMALLYMVFNKTIITSGTAQSSHKVLAFIERIAGYVPIKDVLLAACVLLIVIYLIRSASVFASQFLGYYLRYRVKRDFQSKIFSKFLNSDYSFYVDHKHGWLLYRTVTIPWELASFLDFFPKIALEVSKITAVSISLLLISWPASLVMIFLGGGYYYVTKVIARKVSYHIGKERAAETQRQSELATEAYAGIRQIKIFSSVARWVDTFKESVRRHFRLAVRDAFWLVMPPVLMEFIILAALAAIVMIAKIYFADIFTAILPMVAIFGFATIKLIPSFNRLGSSRISLAGLLPVLEIAYSTMKLPEPIPDGDVELKQFDRTISFKDVDFTYPGRDQLFKRLTFDIKKGKTIAIVGHSGAGKSTIIDLIVRLYTVSGGEIAIDGTRLRDIKLDSWLNKIGFVSQDTFIFNGTIKDNITFGYTQMDFDSIVAVAKDANAHDFIQEFPDGYDTVVGERGFKMSGGQRQRIAIARALLRKPEILILDEATNALDAQSEAIVQKAINNVTKNHTVIIIAHRLSTVVNADKILVLHEGRITGEGTHAELMRTNDVYRSLYEIQEKSFN